MMTSHNEIQSHPRKNHGLINEVRARACYGSEVRFVFNSQQHRGQGSARYYIVCVCVCACIRTEEQGRQYACNVTMLRVPATIVSVDKQQVLHILSVRL